ESMNKLSSIRNAALFVAGLAVFSASPSQAYMLAGANYRGVTPPNNAYEELYGSFPTGQNLQAFALCGNDTGTASWFRANVPAWVTYSGPAQINMATIASLRYGVDCMAF